MEFIKTMLNGEPIHLVLKTLSTISVQKKGDNK